MVEEKFEDNGSLYVLPTDTEADVLRKLGKFLNRNNLSERDELLIHSMLCCCIAIERLEEVTGEDSEYLSYLIGAEAHEQKKVMTKDEKIEFIKETLTRTPMKPSDQKI